MTFIDVGSWLSGGKVRTSDPCGLMFQGDGGKQQAVPLKRRDVTAEICTSTGFSEIKETLSYISDVDCTCVFKFPLPPRSAVYGFRAVLGDREVVTAVKPRAQAQEEYSLAVAQGHGAVLMAQQPDSASLFEVSIGNLEALSEAVVEVRYLRMLDAMGDTLEWLHTATWVPPYIGSAGDIAAGVQQVAAAEPKFAAKVSYSLSYTITIDGSSAPLRAVESPEPITVTQPGPSTHVVTLSEAVCDPSHDLTLLLELAPGTRASGVRAQRSPDGSRTVALATFVPRAEELAQLQREHRERQPTPADAVQPSTALALGLPPPLPTPQAVVPAPSATVITRQQLLQEVWLVVDCSGSMDGEPINQALQAALFFVRDLPTAAGARFNVTCFGSSHVSLYDTPRPYTAATEQQAVAWVQQHVQANLGGTEILRTLEHIYKCPVSSGYTRQVLFLTDGGISGHEEQALLALASKGSPIPGAALRTDAPAPASGPTVVHCLGIGHGVHRGVLDGMAASSGGACVCVVDGEAIARKVAFLRKCALGGEGVLLRPRLVARGALVRSVPHVLPDRLFAGKPLHVLIEVINSAADATLDLTATLPCGTPYTHSLPLGAAVSAVQAAAPAGSAAGAPDAAEGRPQALCVLHAMAYIGSLLEGTSPLHRQPDDMPIMPPPAQDVVRDAVVRLAVASHLVTPHTSAVGVVLRRDPLDPAAVARSEVPLALPAGRTLFSGGARQLYQQYQPCVQQQQQQCYASASMAPMSARAALTAMHKQCNGRGGGRGPAAARYLCKSSAAPPPAPSACAAAYYAPQVQMQEMMMEMDESAAAPLGNSGGGLLRGIKNAAKSFSLFGGGASSRAAAPAPPAAAYAAALPQPKMALDSADWSLRQRSAPLQAVACSAAAAAPEKMELLSYEDEEDEDMGFSLFESGDAAASLALAAPASACPQKRRASRSREREKAKEEAEEEGANRPGGAAHAPLPAAELVSFLNLLRTTQGYWEASKRLTDALGLPLEAVTPAAGVYTHAVCGVRPVGLSDDAFATLLALAVLRRRCGAQREVWADMEAKALAWLGGVWPAGAGRSAAACVLALAKLVPDA